MEAEMLRRIDDVAVSLEPVGIKPARIQIDPVTMRPTDRDGSKR